MPTERLQARRRALVAATIASFVFVGACSGGGSSNDNAESPATTASKAHAKSNGTKRTASGVEPSGEQCSIPPGTQKARVRFVNLFTNPTYRRTAIDVWQGSASDPCGKKLATVPFGHASDYIDVTAADASGNWSATAYVKGATDQDREIVNQSGTWLGGEQATMIVENGAPRSDQPSAGEDQLLLEKNNLGEPALLVPGAGQAALAVGATALQHVVPGDAWFADAAATPGCLRSLSDTDSTKASIGGRHLLVRYSVDPGALALALYPTIPGTCSGTPSIGPVTLDAVAGSSTFVFVYGPDEQHLSLLVLPIAP